MRRAPRRAGFALILVTIELTLLLSFWGLANRQAAGLLLAENALEHRARCDNGSLAVLARALALLETGPPPADPYRCQATVNGSVGDRSYTVVFSSQPGGAWQVEAARTVAGDSPPPMPPSFAPGP